MEYAKRFKCPKCGTFCGPNEIYGCFTFKCPNCENIFEPDEEDE